MKEAREHLIDWLRDAYAMEQQALTMMRAQLERIEHYPELSAQIEEHIDETEDQAAKVEECLKRLGADTSAVKTGMSKIMAGMTSMGASMSGDEIMKETMVCTTFEHYEITNYKILISAAEHAGEPEIAEVCRGILRQEEAMADWLEDHIPGTTDSFLSRDEAGMEAKI